MTDRVSGYWKRRTNWVLFSCLIVALGAGPSGCGEHPGEPISNTVTFKLDFGGGVMLTSVEYRMMGPNNFRRTGSLVVGDQPIVTATFQNLPPGQGYNIQVRGTASDNVTMCKGELTFDVTASMTAMLQIPLTCEGLAGITAVIDSCPVIDGLSAIPSEVRVGATIDVTADVRDADNEPLSPTWQTNGGALSNLSTTGATFTCTDAGTFMVGLRISDGKCNDSSMIRLLCTTP
jgi:hypothetical protein